jgi:hypothetical protein
LAVIYGLLLDIAAGKFARRFLLHVLPGGFHRIRHYGLLADASRRETTPFNSERCFVGTYSAHDENLLQRLACTQLVIYSH